MFILSLQCEAKISFTHLPQCSILVAMSSSTWASSNEEKERVKRTNHDDTDDTSTDETTASPNQPLSASAEANTTMKTANLITISNNMPAEQYALAHGSMMQ